jgi:hypothetical protein
VVVVCMKLFWFLGVTEQNCIEPSLEYQVLARCGGGYHQNKSHIQIFDRLISIWVQALTVPMQLSLN